MRVLLISDDPERKSFDQIAGLKQKILDLDCEVDLFILSNDNVHLNQKIISEKNIPVIKIVKDLLIGKSYNILVISLALKYLKKFFSGKKNIIDLINKISPKMEIFLFGASSLLNSLPRKENVFLYSRPGVDKFTKEFRDDLIDHIVNRLASFS